MKFNPTTKEDLDKTENPEGWFPFEVQGGYDVISEKAKARGETEPDMIKVEMWVYIHGVTRMFRTFLHPAMERYILNFCEAVGLVDEYTSGNLKGSHCDGRSGWVKMVRDTRKTNKDGSPNKYYGKSSPSDFSPVNPNDPDAEMPEMDNPSKDMKEGDEIEF